MRMHTKEYIDRITNEYLDGNPISKIAKENNVSYEAI